MASYTTELGLPYIQAEKDLRMVCEPRGIPGPKAELHLPPIPIPITVKGLPTACAVDMQIFTVLQNGSLCGFPSI